ncbi:MAG: 4-hydroxyphenylacetate decarboxylase small subunit [Anaerolineae bacterium]|nr:4-hydroxyphenylacetate decarboxylase small subunit [Anaerolineae bacterium]
MTQTYKNLDCRNYAPVDAAKGICHARKQLVLADEPACELFEKLPKCKYCMNYTPAAEEYLGTCSASPGQPMTYPDLCAVTCEWFAWKEAG